MEAQDVFRGTPFCGTPTEDWNRLPFWQDFYRGILAKEDSWDRNEVIHREVDLLVRMLLETGELPCFSPQPLLDAGCGISLIPHVLASWGFQVTAIDSCPQAIEVASQSRPSEEELALCLPIWDPCDDWPGTFKLVEDPARSLQLLRSFHAPGGSVSYVAADWFDATLEPETFGVVYCRNSLRCSTKVYWRRSLQRFRGLLSPGGVLLLETLNAIGIQPEVEELIAESGFVTWPARERLMSSKYLLAAWPTG
jgi:2-polyprenyl-3-methyl-5-hydroxy-6-metoxy-1,4-benzoquinol methylase